MHPLISIIILNWNGWKDTIECLESLYQITYPCYDVIVVDNNSEDGSIGKIKQYCEGKLEVQSDFFEYWPINKPIKVLELSEEELINLKQFKSDEYINITIIKNNENYGYAAGNNMGIIYALENLDPDYILLLNNDTVVDKKFLDELIKTAQKDEKIGFFGPKTYYYDYKGRTDVINFAGGRLNLWKGHADHVGINEIDCNQYENNTIVDYVEGSCILIRKKVLEEIGLLETKYFSYWEDSDLCLRGLKNNYPSLYVGNSKIWHKVSSSSDSKFKTYYHTRNKIWFIKKYAITIQYLVFLIYFFTSFSYSSLTYFLFEKEINFKCYLKGIKDGLFFK